MLGSKNFQIAFLRLLVAVLAISLMACSLISPTPPSDEMIRSAINNAQRGWTEIVIHDRQPCELSANTRATGVSERWIITLDYYVPSLRFSDTNQKISVQKDDGVWELASVYAWCG